MFDLPEKGKDVVISFLRDKFADKKKASCQIMDKNRNLTKPAEKNTTKTPFVVQTPYCQILSEGPPTTSAG